MEKLIKTRNNFKKGKKLIHQLPMEVPLELNIDPSSGCNFKCYFCPTGNPELIKSKKRSYKLMSQETFDHVLKSLKKLPTKINKINLYKMGEPLLNKSFEKFVYEIKNIDCTLNIGTTTNAAYLTKERSKKIIENGLSSITISIEHVNKIGYKKITKTFDDIDLIKRNVSDLYENKLNINKAFKVKVKIVNTDLTKEDEELFYNTYKDISDVINIEYLHNWTSEKPEFSENLEFNLEGFSNNEKKVDICSEPFYFLGVTSDGYITPCTVDWAGELVIGHISKMSILEAWNSEKLRKLREQMIHDRSKIKVCKTCTYPCTSRLFTRLDGHKEKLKNLYNC